MTVAVSKALEDGAEAVICASTGNTAASAAAYATRAGLPALVLRRRARSPARSSRRPGCSAHGARGARRLRRGALGGTGARPAGHARARQLAQPDRREGQKTAAPRSWRSSAARRTPSRSLRRRRQHVAYAQALAELGLATPLVSVEAVDRRATLATAIRIGDPVHAAAVRTSGARSPQSTDASSSTPGGGSRPPRGSSASRRPRRGSPRSSAATSRETASS